MSRRIPNSIKQDIRSELENISRDLISKRLSNTNGPFISVNTKGPLISVNTKGPLMLARNEILATRDAASSTNSGRPFSASSSSSSISASSSSSIGAFSSSSISASSSSSIARNYVPSPYARAKNGLSSSVNIGKEGMMAQQLSGLTTQQLSELMEKATIREETIRSPLEERPISLQEKHQIHIQKLAKIKHGFRKSQELQGKSWKTRLSDLETEFNVTNVSPIPMERIAHIERILSVLDGPQFYQVTLPMAMAREESTEKAREEALKSEEAARPKAMGGTERMKREEEAMQRADQSMKRKEQEQKTKANTAMKEGINSSKLPTNREAIGATPPKTNREIISAAPTTTRNPGSTRAPLTNPKTGPPMSSVMSIARVSDKEMGPRISEATDKNGPETITKHKDEGQTRSEEKNSAFQTIQSYSNGMKEIKNVKNASDVFQEGAREENPLNRKENPLHHDFYHDFDKHMENLMKREELFVEAELEKRGLEKQTLESFRRKIGMFKEEFGISIERYIEIGSQCSIESGALEVHASQRLQIIQYLFGSHVQEMINITTDILANSVAASNPNKPNSPPLINPTLIAKALNRADRARKVEARKAEVETDATITTREKGETNEKREAITTATTASRIKSKLSGNAWKNCPPNDEKEYEYYRVADVSKACDATVEGGLHWPEDPGNLNTINNVIKYCDSHTLSRLIAESWKQISVGQTNSSSSSSSSSAAVSSSSSAPVINSSSAPVINSSSAPVSSSSSGASVSLAENDVGSTKKKNKRTKKKKNTNNPAVTNDMTNDGESSAAVIINVTNDGENNAAVINNVTNNGVGVSSNSGTAVALKNESIQGATSLRGHERKRALQREYEERNQTEEEGKQTEEQQKQEQLALKRKQVEENVKAALLARARQERKKGSLKKEKRLREEDQERQQEQERQLTLALIKEQEKIIESKKEQEAPKNQQKKDQKRQKEQTASRNQIEEQADSNNQEEALKKQALEKQNQQGVNEFMLWHQERQRQKKQERYVVFNQEKEDEVWETHAAWKKQQDETEAALRKQQKQKFIEDEPEELAVFQDSLEENTRQRAAGIRTFQELSKEKEELEGGQEKFSVKLSADDLSGGLKKADDLSNDLQSVVQKQHSEPDAVQPDADAAQPPTDAAVNVKINMPNIEAAEADAEAELLQQEMQASTTTINGALNGNEVSKNQSSIVTCSVHASIETNKESRIEASSALLNPKNRSEANSLADPSQAPSGQQKKRASMEDCFLEAGRRHGMCLEKWCAENYDPDDSPVEILKKFKLQTQKFRGFLSQHLVENNLIQNRNLKPEIHDPKLETPEYFKIQMRNSPLPMSEAEIRKMTYAEYTQFLTKTVNAEYSHFLVTFNSVCSRVFREELEAITAKARRAPEVQIARQKAQQARLSNSPKSKQAELVKEQARLYHSAPRLPQEVQLSSEAALAQEVQHAEEQTRRNDNATKSADDEERPGPRLADSTAGEEAKFKEDEASLAGEFGENAQEAQRAEDTKLAKEEIQEIFGNLHADGASDKFPDEARLAVEEASGNLPTTEPYEETVDNFLTDEDSGKLLIEAPSKLPIEASSKLRTDEIAKHVLGSIFPEGPELDQEMRKLKEFKFEVADKINVGSVVVDSVVADSGPTAVDSAPVTGNASPYEAAPASVDSVPVTPIAVERVATESVLLRDTPVAVERVPVKSATLEAAPVAVHSAPNAVEIVAVETAPVETVPVMREDTKNMGRKGRKPAPLSKPFKGKYESRRNETTMWGASTQSSCDFGFQSPQQSQYASTQDLENLAIHSTRCEIGCQTDFGCETQHLVYARSAGLSAGHVGTESRLISDASSVCVNSSHSNWSFQGHSQRDNMMFAKGHDGNSDSNTTSNSDSNTTSSSSNSSSRMLNGMNDGSFAQGTGMFRVRYGKSSYGISSPYLMNNIAAQNVALQRYSHYEEGVKQVRHFSIHLRESGTTKNVGLYDTVKQVCTTAWPKDNKSLQFRLAASLGALILGKGATIVAPLMLGRLVNELSQKMGEAEAIDAVADTAAKSVLSNPLMFDNLLSSPEMLPIWFLVSYGLARLSGSLFEQMKTFLFARVSQNACRQQALNVFKHVHRLDVDYLSSTRSGEIQSTMNRALKSIQSVLHTTIYTVAPTLLEFGFTLCVVTSHMGVTSSFIVLSTFAGYFGFTTWYSNIRREHMKGANHAEDKLGGLLIDSIVNCEAVRYFGNQKFESDRYDKNLAKYEKNQIEVLQSLAYLNFGQQLILNSGLIAIMALGTANVLSGTMFVGDLVALNTLVLQLAVPLNFLGGAYRITLQGVLDIQRLNDFLAKEPKIVSGSQPYEYKGGEILVQNVHCRALKGIHMHIEAGSKIGIVGPSGSGKSTILKLLTRLADPEKLQDQTAEKFKDDEKTMEPTLKDEKFKGDEQPIEVGSIKIDGQDLRELDTNSYIKYLGIVPQESLLFNDTVFYNLRYADPNASEEDIYNACKSAQIHDVIEGMDKGYETIVGERGNRLSGGERQRIAIARCLLRDPQILLFDEATASLDLQTEANLAAAIDSFQSKYANKTMIFVAHRLSTVQKCDKIFYVEDGKIAEQGSHTELMAREDSKYRALWDLNEALGTDSILQEPIPRTD